MITHYDANDPHQNNLDDVLEPDELDRRGLPYSQRDAMEAELIARAAKDIGRENIVYVKGIAYQLSSYGEAYPDGSRNATLRIYRPF